MEIQESCQYGIPNTKRVLVSPLKENKEPSLKGILKVPTDFKKKWAEQKTMKNDEPKVRHVHFDDDSTLPQKAN